MPFNEKHLRERAALGAHSFRSFCPYGSYLKGSSLQVLGIDELLKYTANYTAEFIRFLFWCNLGGGGREEGVNSGKKAIATEM